MIKLGSLFDGIGGFPLAAVMNGITPVWASEIESFPMRVTKERFPSMAHLGNVTKINGTKIEPVDVVTFGSPCQDMSIAGKREGLDGERSGLFRQAIRIIREMRTATNRQYPRFAVWENVPGTFSSNNGKDFQTVIESLCRVEEEGREIPMPGSGKWQTAGLVAGEGYSVAWRVLDAQYWGVAQRRRRIYAVADFGGQCAGKILFEREGVRRHTAEGRSTGEGTAGSAESGARTYCIQRSDEYKESCVGSTISRRDYKSATDLICYNVTFCDANGRRKDRPNGGLYVNETEKSGTLTGKTSGYKTSVVNWYKVRRLTPLECERLHGYPDGWTDIECASDTARYKALGNSVAIPCVEFVIGGIAEILRSVSGNA